MHRATVLMPVYNSESYLSEAIDSILCQTFRDFKFLIINDGSSDATAEIIGRYEDERISCISLNQNGGIVAALNTGLKHVSGDYIVRMDADDISDPRRLEKQIGYMDKNPDVGVCGSGVEYFGIKSGVYGSAESHNEIIWSMLFGSPFYHPTVIIRLKTLQQHDLQYPSLYPHAEDFALWVSMIGKTRFANLHEPLVKYRFIGDSVSSRNRQEQIDMSLNIRRMVHDKLLGIPIDDNDWLSIVSENKVVISLARVISIYEGINAQNQLLTESLFRSKIYLLAKQFILRKKVDLNSCLWIFRQIPHDIGFLKYFFIALSKRI